MAWSHSMPSFLVYTFVLTLFQARKLVKITIYKETERKTRAKLILKIQKVIKVILFLDQNFSNVFSLTWSATVLS